MAGNVRLYVDHPLGEGQSVPLTREQANYLFAVMRLPAGTVLTLMNSRDGAWDAMVVEGNKRGGILLCQAQTAPLEMPPDLWLVFAPVRKERTAFIVEKAVELGARRLIPVQTAYTNNADRIRPDKMQAQVIEAAEQCGATYVPQVVGLTKLGALLSDWPSGRNLLFCDENMVGQPHDMGGCHAPAGILIGPQGGFSPEETVQIRAVPDARGISLGPRILRAETAALAALTLWQAAAGDWQ